MGGGGKRQGTASPLRAGDGRRAGFTLIDVLMALTIMALIAAVVLPGLRRPAGPLALRTAAYQLSAMLRNLRTSAIAAGRPLAARIEPGADTTRVTAGTVAVEIPPGISIAFADRRKPALSFAPDGTSSGGTFVLWKDAVRLAVAVNADTGAISVGTP